MGRQSTTHVCIVLHHSDIRPRGYEMAKQFIDGWKESKLDFRLIILDNQSTIDYDFLNGVKHDFIRVDDQIKSGGCTGAWNTLCRYSIENGAEKIMGFADDVIPNSSLNILAQNTIDDNTIYAPLTDGMIGAWRFQMSDKPINGFRKTVPSLNGFWLSFTRKFWIDKNVDGDLFLMSKNPYIDMWAGQELMMNVWNKKYNTQGEVIGDCWIHHTKLRSWKEARKQF